MNRNRHSLRALVLPLLLLLCLGWHPKARAAQFVHITVSVTDEKGNAIPEARVNVYQQEPIRSSWLDVPVPVDYQKDTNARGLAPFQIKLATGQDLDVTIEVSKENMQTQSRRINPGKNFATRLALEKFVLKKKADTGGTDIVEVLVAVESEGKPLPGAKVVIRDDSLGAATGRFPGATDAEGKTSIRVWYAATSDSETLPIDVSKNGYKNGSGAVTLKKKDIGKTIPGPTIALEKQSKSGTFVTVNVVDAKTKQPLPGAMVTLDGPGYHYENTNASGVVSFVVPETGTFEVRVTEENHRPFKSEVRVLSNEQDKPPVVCEMEPKITRDEGSDVIDVTVLWKDTTDEMSKPAPLKGATVRAGRIAEGTDESGKAKLQGAFDEKQEVVVEAPGYTSKREIVNVAKILHYSAGKGTVTFILEPVLSENSLIRVVVEVVDAAGAKIEGAGVEFFSLSGARVSRGTTNWGGEVEFLSSKVASVPIAELRKGITVSVKKAPDFKEVLNRSIPANLLKPSLEGGRYQIQLERDWTELEKAIASLEAQIAAWKSAAQTVTAKAQSVATLSTKSAEARRRGESLLGELKAARKAADAKRSEAACKDAKELEKAMSKWEQQAADKEKLLRSTLDEATALANNCKSKADAETIRAKQKSALVLAAELGRLEKQALEDNKSLAKLIQGFGDPGPTIQVLQQFVAKLEEETAAAGKDAAAADNGFEDAVNKAKTLPGRQAELLKVYDEMRVVHHVREYQEVLPRDIRKRLDNLEATLSPTGNDVSMRLPPTIDGSRLKIIKETLTILEQYRRQAVDMVDEYQRATCDARPQDHIVKGLGDIMAGVTIELGAAGDLLGKADACAAKDTAASASPSSTPQSDEITVPDFKGYTDPSKMIAVATQAGLKPSLAASNEAPASDGAGVVVRQNPLANAKAKRGDPLTIFLSQKKVMPTPSPTPTPVTAATPSPKAGDEVIVPSIPAGTTVAEAKATLSAAGLAAAFNAKGGKPDSQDLEFKTTGAQEPPGGTKTKRGKTVTVSIYQKYEAKTSPTPTSTSAPSPSATAASGTVPDLTKLTLDQAVGRVPAGMRVYGVEMGAKPPKPELALTIFAQTPAAGTKYDPKNPPAISVKIYGEAAVAPPPVTNSDPFVGTWTGMDWGDPKKPVEMMIRYVNGGYDINYGKSEYTWNPVKREGTKLVTIGGFGTTTFVLVGDTLEATKTWQDFRGNSNTDKRTFRRK